MGNFWTNSFPFFRLKGPDFGINAEEIDEDEREIRVVLTAPHKGQFLSDPIFFITFWKIHIQNCFFARIFIHFYIYFEIRNGKIVQLKYGKKNFTSLNGIFFCSDNSWFKRNVSTCKFTYIQGVSSLDVWKQTLIRPSKMHF